jgi:hypothetical protein
LIGGKNRLNRIFIIESGQKVIHLNVIKIGSVLPNGGSNLTTYRFNGIVSLFSRLWNLFTLSFCNNSSNSSYLST